LGKVEACQCAVTGRGSYGGVWNEALGLRERGGFEGSRHNEEKSPSTLKVEGGTKNYAKDGVRFLPWLGGRRKKPSMEKRKEGPPKEGISLHPAVLIP